VVTLGSGQARSQRSGDFIRTRLAHCAFLTRRAMRASGPVAPERGGAKRHCAKGDRALRSARGLGFGGYVREALVGLSHARKRPSRAVTRRCEAPLSAGRAGCAAGVASLICRRCL